MAEDNADKTEAPTPRRRQEARDQGQIARSADLTAAVLLISSIYLLSWYGNTMITTMKNIVETMLSQQTLSDFRVPLVATVFMSLFTQVMLAMWPLLLGLLVIAIAMNLVQVGFYFNPSRLAPNFAALNPTRGLSRIFGKGQGVVSLLMNVFKIFMVGGVAYSAVHDRIGLILNSQSLDYNQIMMLGAQVLYSIAIRIAVLLLVLAIIDFAYQKFRIEKELKMSKQEIKDEMKRMEGDPHIKQRRRQIMQQRAMQRIKQAVPTADVIVTNPTHYAVALKYDPTMRSPKVVAKGADFLAFRIRELAADHGIPILERPPLARSLYRDVDIGEEIPEEFYAAVAEILAYVYELTGKSRKPVPAGV